DNYATTERKTTQGVYRAYEAMLAIEKPIVARMNGDAVAFNGGLLWACDIIVAREDAVYADHHLGFVRTPHLAIEDAREIAGDGGCLLPIYMTPTKAKECL